MTPVRIGTASALLAAAVVACDTPSEPAASTDRADSIEANAAVDDVVDGDTVDVIIDGREERVRLIGIDTPETKKPNSPIECFGPEASSFTEQLLPVGTELYIERDIVGRDDYGRLLGYLYRADDGLFVNDEIVRKGFAQPLSIAPNTAYADVFVEAARMAEQDDIGLWAECADRPR
ncbi:thermonuclease family protein [Ilumatobacter sp.]|uniref:thermonuclease family protein n=1 Tax=Ilumatobacter sp. TaxID=1967498 RepID=UPI003C3F67BE